MLPTRYDGRAQNKQEIVAIIELLKANDINIIPVCPEQLGGLSTPRTPAEIKGNQVIDKDGKDVTQAFKKGAKLTQDLVLMLDVDFAILKQSSPSCGSKFIYDGNHSGTKIQGRGITTDLLERNGISVYSEDDMSLIKDRIESCKWFRELDMK